MAKTIFISLALVLLIASVSSAPAEVKDVELLREKEDLAPSEKDDLKTAASHWGGHYGGYGGWGGYGHYGGYYPHYGSYWGGWPSYGYWPYGGYYGHHGYWW